MTASNHHQMTQYKTMKHLSRHCIQDHNIYWAPSKHGFIYLDDSGPFWKPAKCNISVLKFPKNFSSVRFWVNIVLMISLHDKIKLTLVEHKTRYSGISLLPTCHYQPSENVCYWVTSFFSFSKLSLQSLHSAGLVCKKLATCSPDAAVDLEIFRYKKKYFVMTRDSWPRSSSRTQRGDKWRLWRENVTHSRRAAAAWEPGHWGQTG